MKTGGCKNVMVGVEHRGPKGRGRQGAEGSWVWGGGVHFRSPNGDFWCILLVFSTIQLPVLHAKTGAFGLPKFAVVIHCCLPS